MPQHIKPGGPAFPCECTNDGHEETTGFNNDVIPAGTTCQYRGMTMRGYFAAKVMQALLPNTIGDFDDDSRNAYQIADAMLRAREQQ